MGTVRALGLSGNETNTKGGRLLQRCPDGTLLALLRDSNDSGESGGDKSGTAKLYVYSSADNGTTWTQRVTLNYPSGFGTIRGLTSMTFDNGDLGIAVSDNSSKLYYCRITKSTWTASAWETVGFLSDSSDIFTHIDMASSPSGQPVIVTMGLTNWGGTTIVIPTAWPRSPAGTWGQGGQLNPTPYPPLYGGLATLANRVIGCETATAIYVGSGVYGGDNVDNYYAAFGYGDKSTGDGGVVLYQFYIKQDTGTVRWSNNTLITYGAGEGNKSSTRTQGRIARLFSSGNNEWTLAIAHGEVNRKLILVRGTGSGLSGPNVTLGPVSSTMTGYAASKILDRGLGIQYNNDTVNFLAAVTDASPSLINYVATFDRTVSQVYWGTQAYKFDALTSYDYMPFGGGPYNLDTATSNVIGVIKRSGSATTTNHTWRSVASVNPGVSVVITSPADSGTVTKSLPSLVTSCYLEDTAPQSMYRLQWQFSTAVDFSADLQTYTQSKAKRFDLDHSQPYTISDTLPSSQTPLKQGAWYARARVLDDFGGASDYSATVSFTVSHPPTAILVSPANGANLNFPSSNQVLFSWNFSDPSPIDVQTAYQLIIEDGSGVVKFDSGKVISDQKSVYITVDNTYKDVSLRWKAAVWDTDDVQGPFSAYNTFGLLTPPSAVIDSPTQDEIIATAIPTFLFTPTIPGGRTVVQHTVRVTQGDTLIWNKTTTPSVGIGTGVQIAVTADSAILKNNQSYSVSVTITDSAGLTVDADNSPVVFTTQWTPPPAPTVVTVDESLYNTEDAGYVSVMWDDAERDPDFTNWVVYRKDDLIDTDTSAVIEEGEWNEIYVEYNTGDTYEYHDYLAPSSYQVNYRVSQVVTRFGDSVESVGTDSDRVAFPVAEGYWLVEPQTADSDADAFKIAYVTGDNYTDEYEQSEYNVIGRGRHVDTGQHLGRKGQLDTQIRRTSTRTARQMKLRLLEIKEEARILYLRTPFGDTFRVSVGDMQITHVAGVGRSEFVDVSLPYSEVSQ